MIAISFLNLRNLNGLLLLTAIWLFNKMVLLKNLETYFNPIYWERLIASLRLYSNLLPGLFLQYLLHDRSYFFRKIEICCVDLLI